MTDKELDELMYKKLNEYKENLDINLNAEKIIKTGKKVKIRKLIIKIGSIAACLIIIMTFCIMQVINKKDTNNVTADNNQEIQESYGIIEVNEMEKIQDMDIPDSSTACYSYNSISYLYNDYKNNRHDTEGVIIAKVNSLKYTNYDKTWGVDMNIENDYVSPRTIANITINKCLIGDYNVGSDIEIRVKGGIIEYDEYVKERERYGDTDVNFDYISKEYEALLKQNKDKIYVSIFNKKHTRLEEGKTYIMFIHKKISGDYWIEAYNEWLREYDEKTNSILNYNTGEYEKLEDVLEEVK